MQCEKSLFLHFFKPELRDEISDSQQAIFDTGHNVGELAQQRFPGVLVQAGATTAIIRGRWLTPKG